MSNLPKLPPTLKPPTKMPWQRAIGTAISKTAQDVGYGGMYAINELDNIGLKVQDALGGSHAVAQKAIAQNKQDNAQHKVNRNIAKSEINVTNTVKGLKENTDYRMKTLDEKTSKISAMLNNKDLKLSDEQKTQLREQIANKNAEIKAQRSAKQLAAIDNITKQNTTIDPNTGKEKIGVNLFDVHNTKQKIKDLTGQDTYSALEKAQDFNKQFTAPILSGVGKAGGQVVQAVPGLLQAATNNPLAQVIYQTNKNALGMTGGVINDLIHGQNIGATLRSWNRNDKKMFDNGFNALNQGIATKLLPAADNLGNTIGTAVLGKTDGVDLRTAAETDTGLSATNIGNLAGQMLPYMSGAGEAALLSKLPGGVGKFLPQMTGWAEGMGGKTIGTLGTRALTKGMQPGVLRNITRAAVNETLHDAPLSAITTYGDLKGQVGRGEITQEQMNQNLPGALIANSAMDTFSAGGMKVLGNLPATLKKKTNVPTPAIKAPEANIKAPEIPNVQSPNAPNLTPKSKSQIEESIFTAQSRIARIQADYDEDIPPSLYKPRDIKNYNKAQTILNENKTFLETGKTVEQIKVETDAKVAEEARVQKLQETNRAANEKSLIAQEQARIKQETQAAKLQQAEQKAQEAAARQAEKEKYKSQITQQKLEQAAARKTAIEEQRMLKDAAKKPLIYSTLTKQISKLPEAELHATKTKLDEIQSLTPAHKAELTQYIDDTITSRRVFNAQSKAISPVNTPPAATKRAIASVKTLDELDKIKNDIGVEHAELFEAKRAKLEDAELKTTTKPYAAAISKANNIDDLDMMESQIRERPYELDGVSDKEQGYLLNRIAQKKADIPRLAAEKADIINKQRQLEGSTAFKKEGRAVSKTELKSKQEIVDTIFSGPTGEYPLPELLEKFADSGFIKSLGLEKAGLNRPKYEGGFDTFSGLAERFPDKAQKIKSHLRNKLNDPDNAANINEILNLGKESSEVEAGGAGVSESFDSINDFETQRGEADVNKHLDEESKYIAKEMYEKGKSLSESTKKLETAKTKEELNDIADHAEKYHEDDDGWDNFYNKFSEHSQKLDSETKPEAPTKAPEAKPENVKKADEPKPEPKLTPELQEKVDNLDIKAPEEVKSKLFRIGRDIFGLDNDKAGAFAIIIDRMLNAIAKRDGKTAAEAFKSISFRKGADAELKARVGEVHPRAKGAAIEIEKTHTAESLLEKLQNKGDVKYQKNTGDMIVKDAEHLVYALTDPDVSTPLHEMAHVYERVLNKSEISHIEAWSGHKQGTNEFSEAFARGFEKYLADGEAPTKELRTVFKQFKEWMLEIYRGIKNSSIDMKLNDEMKNIYRTMLDADELTKEFDVTEASGAAGKRTKLIATPEEFQRAMRNPKKWEQLTSGYKNLPIDTETKISQLSENKTEFRQKKAQQEYVLEQIKKELEDSRLLKKEVKETTELSKRGEKVEAWLKEREAKKMNLEKFAKNDKMTLRVQPNVDPKAVEYRQKPSLEKLIEDYNALDKDLKALKKTEDTLKADFDKNVIPLLDERGANHTFRDKNSSTVFNISRPITNYGIKTDEILGAKTVARINEKYGIKGTEEVYAPTHTQFTQKGEIRKDFDKGDVMNIARKEAIDIRNSNIKNKSAVTDKIDKQNTALYQLGEEMKKNPKGFFTTGNMLKLAVAVAEATVSPVDAIMSGVRSFGGLGKMFEGSNNKALIQAGETIDMFTGMSRSIETRLRDFNNPIINKTIDNYKKISAQEFELQSRMSEAINSKLLTKEELEIVEDILGKKSPREVEEWLDDSDNFDDFQNLANPEARMFLEDINDLRSERNALLNEIRGDERLDVKERLALETLYEMDTALSIAPGKELANAANAVIYATYLGNNVSTMMTVLTDIPMKTMVTQGARNTLGAIWSLMTGEYKGNRLLRQLGADNLGTGWDKMMSQVSDVKKGEIAKDFQEGRNFAAIAKILAVASGTIVKFDGFKFLTKLTQDIGLVAKAKNFEKAYKKTHGKKIDIFAEFEKPHSEIKTQFLLEASDTLSQLYGAGGNNNLHKSSMQTSPHLSNLFFLKSESMRYQHLEQSLIQTVKNEGIKTTKGKVAAWTLVKYKLAQGMMGGAAMTASTPILAAALTVLPPKQREEAEKAIDNFNVIKQLGIDLSAKLGTPMMYKKRGQDWNQAVKNVLEDQGIPIIDFTAGTYNNIKKGLEYWTAGNKEQAYYSFGKILPVIGSISKVIKTGRNLATGRESTHWVKQGDRFVPVKKATSWKDPLGTPTAVADEQTTEYSKTSFKNLAWNMIDLDKNDNPTLKNNSRFEKERELLESKGIDTQKLIDSAIRKKLKRRNEGKEEAA